MRPVGSDLGVHELGGLWLSLLTAGAPGVHEAAGSGPMQTQSGDLTLLLPCLGDIIGSGSPPLAPHNTLPTALSSA